jgi:hypothetical protein
MSESRSHCESEKSQFNNPIDPDRIEAEDIITALSSMKTTHRRPSLGIKHSIWKSAYIVHIDESIHVPPSFAESQFATIVRRQRPRDTALKISNVPSRYPNLLHDFEFAGYKSLFL